MNAILRAAEFAKNAHRGQSRKYSLDPYIFHPMRVAGRVSMLENATENMVIAAWLHDTIEDCGVTRERLASQFGEKAASLVYELTTPDGPPGATREHLKALQRAHCFGMSRDAKRIKLVDRWDNIRDLRDAPTQVIDLYVAETVRLVEESLKDADPDMASNVMFQCGILRGRALRDGDPNAAPRGHAPPAGGSDDKGK